MAKHSNKHLAKFINDAMDVSGFSKRSICARASFYTYVAGKMNDFASYYGEFCPEALMEFIMAGSRNEGVVQVEESDMDTMIVFRKCICLDLGRFESGLEVFQTDTSSSPPGYTKLMTTYSDREWTIFTNREGDIYLPSSSGRNFLEGLYRVIGNSPFPGFECEISQKSGPSVQILGKVSNLPMQPNLPAINYEEDNVLAMPFLSGKYLETWKERHREHEWPARDVIRDISSMEGFVVPIGPKFSEDQEFEWRICYTTAEQKLVSHFNSVQLKLYVLLKMIFKQIIRPECDIITSYMVKNIVFWVCEGQRAASFTPEALVDLLLYSFNFVLQCLHSNFLPNYMIPIRNLLLGKGNTRDRLKLRQILRELLKEGGAVIYRVRKLGNMVHVMMKSPWLGKSYGEWRDEVEKYCLMTLYLELDKISLPMSLQYDWPYKMQSMVSRDPQMLQVKLHLLQLFNIDFNQVCRDPVGSQQLYDSMFERFVSGDI